jgi:phosphatidylinositol alpha-1,6-mannosyltransferase
MARVLAEAASAGDLRVAGLALDDDQPAGDMGFPVRTARRSRIRFVADVALATWSFSHFVYDFLGMARAHGRVPFIHRPSLVFIHGIDVWENVPAHRITTARRVDVLVANTSYTRDRADRVHGGFSRARVCWLATESDEPPPCCDGPPARPPRVLIVGRMDHLRYKGHNQLIECWPEVVASVPDAILTVVGSGPTASHFRELASRSPAADRIDFRGFVSDEEIERQFQVSTVFAMPSRGEGFGLVYIEAMRHGIPVIASVHDAAQEVNVDGETGFNVDLDRPHDLPDRLVYLLKNRDRAAAMGRAGRQRWFDHFRYSAFRERFMPILKEFLAIRGVSAR